MNGKEYDGRKWILHGTNLSYNVLLLFKLIDR